MPQNTTTSQAYLTPRQAAEYINIGYSTLLRDYPGWIRYYGVEVTRYGSKMLRFNKASLDRMMKTLNMEA
jgi:hypothetical protein